MKIEIDQSGHVEYTSTKTTIGDSSGNSITIKSVDKRRIQKIYRDAGKSRLFIVELFALLVTVIIKKTYKREHIYKIDIEYPGKDEIITDYLIKFSRQLDFELKHDQIRFGLISKKSKAHETSYYAFKGKTIGGKIDYRKILKILLP